MFLGKTWHYEENAQTHCDSDLLHQYYVVINSKCREYMALVIMAFVGDLHFKNLLII